MVRVGAAARQRPIPRYPIQLVDAYVNQVSATRHTLAEWVGPEPGTLDISVVDRRAEPNRRAGSIVLQAALPYAFRQEAIAHIVVSVVAHFKADEEVDRATWDAFTNGSGVVVTMPYLRAAVGEVGRMMGFQMPPLPTIDVLALLETPDDKEPLEEKPKGRKAGARTTRRTT